jgi:hypothetical protein
VEQERDYNGSILYLETKNHIQSNPYSVPSLNLKPARAKARAKLDLESDFFVPSLAYIKDLGIRKDPAHDLLSLRSVLFISMERAAREKPRLSLRLRIRVHDCSVLEMNSSTVGDINHHHQPC